MGFGELGHRMRYCPACAHWDLAERGYTYYRVYHQAPGVYVCPTHADPLERYRRGSRPTRGGPRSVLPLGESPDWTARPYPLPRDLRAVRGHLAYARVVRELWDTARCGYGRDVLDAAVLLRLAELGVDLFRGWLYVRAAIRDMIFEAWGEPYLDDYCRTTRHVFRRHPVHDVALVAGALYDQPRLVWRWCDRIVVGSDGTDLPRAPLQRRSPLLARVGARDQAMRRLAAMCGPGRLHCRVCTHEDPRIRHICRDILPDGAMWDEYTMRLSAEGPPTYWPQYPANNGAYRLALERVQRLGTGRAVGF